MIMILTLLTFADCKNRKHQAMRPTHIQCNGNLLSIEKPLIAGILNVTPDSFFDGGQYTQKEAILKRADKIISEGADFIDIGAVSTRPGAKMPSEKEELARLLPALEIIRSKWEDVIISIDTFRAEVARQAVAEFNVQIINDISAGEYDPEMPKLMAELQTPYIIMHKQGMPENMQNSPKYNEIVKELIIYFSKKINKFRLMGISDIIIDPGFGFGKTLEHNYTLMENLEQFQVLECPILVGVSRKSMIYNLIGTTPETSLNGSTVLHKTALDKKADILRVHDVKEARQTIDIFLELKKHSL